MRFSTRLDVQIIDACHVVALHSSPHCRGENVVLLGELDAAREPPAGLLLVSEAAIKQAQRAEHEADKIKGTLRARFDFLDDT